MFLSVQHLGALESAGDVLVLTTMRFAHEIRSAKDLDLPKTGEANAKEMKLAHQLIDTLGAKWDPTEFQDSYTDVLRKAIEQKIQGKEISIPQPEQRARVANLMKALEASLKSGAARKEPAKAAARARAPQKRRPGRRAA